MTITNFRQKVVGSAVSKKTQPDSWDTFRPFVPYYKTASGWEKPVAAYFKTTDLYSNEYWQEAYVESYAPPPADGTEFTVELIQATGKDTTPIAQASFGGTSEAGTAEDVKVLHNGQWVTLAAWRALSGADETGVDPAFSCSGTVNWASSPDDVVVSAFTALHIAPKVPMSVSTNGPNSTMGFRASWLEFCRVINHDGKTAGSPDLMTRLPDDGPELVKGIYVGDGTAGPVYYLPSLCHDKMPIVKFTSLDTQVGDTLTLTFNTMNASSGDTRYVGSDHLSYFSSKFSNDSPRRQRFRIRITYS